MPAGSHPRSKEKRKYICWPQHSLREDESLIDYDLSCILFEQWIIYLKGRKFSDP